MERKLPYVIVLEEFRSRGTSIQDWVEENSFLMNELVSEGAEILMNNSRFKKIDLIELWHRDKLAAVIELERNYLDEALENNMNNWVSCEEYERAAHSRDLLEKFKNSK